MATEPVIIHDLKDKADGLTVLTSETIFTHSWDDGNSLISSLDHTLKYSGEIHRNALGKINKTPLTGNVTLHLRGAPGDASSLEEQAKILIKAGYRVYPSGSSDLVVARIMDEGQLNTLVDFLEKEGLATGGREGVAREDDYTCGKVRDIPGKEEMQAAPPSMKIINGIERVQNWLDTQAPVKSNREQRLRASGTVGVLGHIALALQGMIRGKPELILTAALYGGSASAISLLGAGGEMNFPHIVDDACADIEKKGYLVAEDASNVHRDTMLHHDGAKGVGRQGQELIQDYAVKAPQIPGLTGNLAMINASLKEEGGFKTKIGKLMHGVAGMLGTIAVLTVKEDPALTEMTVAERKLKIETRNQELAGKPFYVKAGAQVMDFVRYSPFLFSAGLQLIDNMAMIFEATVRGSEQKKVLEGYSYREGNVFQQVISWAKKEKPTHVPPVKDQIAEKLGEYNKMLHSKEMTPFDLTKVDEMIHAPKGIQFDTAIPEANKLREEILKLQKEQLSAEKGGKLVPLLAWVTALTWTGATVLNLFSTTRRDPALTDDSAYREMYALSAAKVLQQPEQFQPEFQKQLAFSLSQRLGGSLSVDTVIAGISTAAEQIKDSPWLLQAERLQVKGEPTIEVKEQSAATDRKTLAERVQTHAERNAQWAANPMSI